ncbi:MAG: nicotinate-nicotinamide nucleotide adenylyltransferase [Leptospira sp.]|uniref:Probable nicotinate-nucleotide adenylyltransferase n=1 Tax=Leptospira paudalimensis TaxID=2950024 RepID=A0ABT3M6M0_9LEPT|nr:MULTISPECIES: nicotinate-nicotinamide nucleotide adenylyltransferase [Leptospira]MBL0955872.1 nicotinate-nicotinamide nucleotide adenylyltransferase [Leptospira sp.]MCW7504023.1 nicotinate-nicotinamide nucleotide adenylyltransferase [Leptospira paudalimensis]
MDVVLFGGSFNPPHIGHRHVISSLIKQFPESKIYICPNFLSPFKLNEIKFSKGEIWSLCLSEFQEFLSDNVILWDEEIKKDTTSFTIDTLTSLQSLEKDGSISLVIGEDNLQNFNQWKSYEQILKKIQKLIIVRRNTEYPNSILIPNFIDEEQLLVLNNPIVKMSSTEIRNQPKHEWQINSILPQTKSLLDSYLQKRKSFGGDKK